MTVEEMFTLTQISDLRNARDRKETAKRNWENKRGNGN